MAAEIGIDCIIEKLSSFCAVILKTAVSLINVSRETKALLREERGRFELWGDGFLVSEGKLDRLLLGNDQDRQLWESVVIVLSGLAGSLRPVMDGIPEICSGSASDLSNQLSRLLRKVLEILPDSTFLIEPQVEGEFGEEVNWEILIEDIEQSVDSLFDLAPYIDELYLAESHKEELRHEDHEPSILVETQDYWGTVILEMFPGVDQKLASVLAKVQGSRERRLSECRKKCGCDEPPEHKLGDTFSRGSVMPGDFKGFMSSGEIDSSEIIQAIIPEAVHLSLGTKFRCNICCEMLENVHDRQCWVTHFLEDTKPFSCLTSSCPEWGITFGSCKSWLDHEFQHHRYVSEWICVGSCRKTFHTKGDFLAHTLEAHIGGTSPTIGRMLDDIAGNCERRHPPTRKINCPFCQLEIEEARISFEGHVAMHMVQVALKVVHGFLASKGDRVSEMEMMEAVCVQDGGRELRLLLSKGGKVTEAVVKRAAGYWNGKAYLKLLLSIDNTISITEEMLVIAAGNTRDILEVLLDKGGEVTEAVMLRAAGNLAAEGMLEVLLSKGGVITEAVLYKAMGNMSNHGLCRLLLGGCVEVTERIMVEVAGMQNSGKVLEALLDKGGKVTGAVIAKAASNGNGKEILRILLDKGGEVTEAVMLGAVGDLSCSQETLKILLEKGVEVTEAVMVGVVGGRSCSQEMLKIMLERGGEVTQAVMVGAVSNRNCSQETLEILLERGGGEVTQAVMIGAVSNLSCSQETLKILLERGGGEVTEVVMVGAVGNLSCSQETLKIMLERGGEVTEAVMVRAVGNLNCSQGMLKILLERGGEVTEAVMVGAASNRNCSQETLEILLERGGGEVTEAMMVGAVGNRSCSQEMLKILLDKGGEVTGAVMARVIAGMANNGRCNQKILDVLVEGGGQITGAMIAEVEHRFSARDMKILRGKIHDAGQSIAHTYSPQVLERRQGRNDVGDNIWGYLYPFGGFGEGTAIKLGARSPSLGELDLETVGGKGKQKQLLKSVFIVGRHDDCDLVINEPAISNRHCVISKEVSESQTTVVLEDISSGETWVGGVAVGKNERQTLNSGDEIKFVGGRRYIFRYPGDIQESDFYDLT